MLGGNRLERVNELIRHELSGFVRREIEFDPGILVTVTNVSVSSDLEHARVWVSVLPFDHHQAVLEKLNAHIGKLQHLLNRKLVMETVPRIRFLLDEGGDRASRIERLLDSLDGNG